MFDTHIHRRDTAYVTKEVNITEKRAPTDESVKLLAEFENKARDKLVSITKLEGNIFEATWHVFDDMCSWDLMVHCRFKLNEHTHEFKFAVDRNCKQLGEKCRDKIIERIGLILTMDVFKAAKLYNV